MTASHYDNNASILLVVTSWYIFFHLGGFCCELKTAIGKEFVQVMAFLEFLLTPNTFFLDGFSLAHNFPQKEGRTSPPCSGYNLSSNCCTLIQRFSQVSALSKQIKGFKTISCRFFTYLCLKEEG